MIFKDSIRIQIDDRGRGCWDFAKTVRGAFSPERKQQHEKHVQIPLRTFLYPKPTLTF